MQISDEMVEAARDSLIESSGKTYYPSNYQIRAALDAALGKQRKPPAFNIVRDMHGPLDAIACIEELADALKPFAKLHVDEGDYEETDISAYEINTVSAGAVRKARATLERWGLK